MSAYSFLRNAEDVRPGERVVLPGDDLVRTATSVTVKRDEVHVRFTNGERENFRRGAAVNIDGAICDECSSICDPDGYCPTTEYH